MVRGVSADAQLVLGHGASGSAASMRPYVDALRQLHIRADAIELPKGNAERAKARFAARLHAAPAPAIGGHSYGGRVASLVAAERSVPALVLISYPLHRPGHTEELRTEHWPDIACPVLVLSGEADPFARIDLLRQEVQRLRRSTVHTWPGIGHGLLSVVEAAADHIAAFLRTVLN